MMNKFPVQIARKSERSEEFLAATSITIVTGLSRNIRQELRFVEQDYTVLVRSVRDAINMGSKTKRTDPRLYWIAADAMLGFLSRIGELGFYLLKQNKTLGRDIGLSESTVKKMLAFRRRFPRISLVDPAVSWAQYRANRVQVPNIKQT